jgi:nucleotide-binding universal stress UspA family protein
MAVALSWHIMRRRAVHPPGLFRAILCPVDFSQPSAVALRYAAVFARRPGGRLHVFDTSHLMAAAAAATPPGERDHAGTTDAEVRAFVDRALPAAIRATLSIDCTAPAAGAGATIERAARQLKCDLIVMGTQGVGSMKKDALGSTGERLLRRAAVPVLAIPPMLTACLPRLWPNATILVPLDLGKSSASEVRDAERIARALGADLLLTSVIRPLRASFRADLSAAIRLRSAAAARRLKSLARTAGAGIRVKTRVMCGDVADQIAELALEERIAMVLMRRRRGARLFGSPPGSIAWAVLRQGVTAVLALPERRARPHVVPVSMRASA